MWIRKTGKKKFRSSLTKTKIEIWINSIFDINHPSPVYQSQYAKYIIQFSFGYNDLKQQRHENRCYFHQTILIELAYIKNTSHILILSSLPKVGKKGRSSSGIVPQGRRVLVLGSFLVNQSKNRALEKFDQKNPGNRDFLL